MKKLAIGKPGDTWKPEYEAQLLDAIKSIYGGHFPYTYSPGEVVDELSRHYVTGHSDNALYEEIKFLLNKEGGVFKTLDISKDRKTVLVQEYSDAKHLDKRLFTGKVSEQDRVKSEISISQKKRGESNRNQPHFSFSGNPLSGFESVPHFHSLECEIHLYNNSIERDESNIQVHYPAPERKDQSKWECRLSPF